MPAAPPAPDALRDVELFRCFAGEELGAFAGALHPRRVAAGDVIVREDDEDRALFVMVSGRARVVSDGVHLGAVEAGEHFGELALIAGGRRTASVIADTECALFVLDAAAFDAFAERHARLAIRLLREVVARTSGQLARMNETVSLLLRERGLPRRVDVTVHVGDEARVCRSGTPAMDLLPAGVDGAPVVAALVDGRARPLNEPLAGDCVLAPLTTTHWEGQRIYRRSLGLAVLEAAANAGISVRVGPSLGFAQRLLIEDGSDPAGASETLERELRALVARDAPLVRERLSVLEALDYFERVGWREVGDLVETTRHRTVPLSSYGEVFVLASGPLLPSTGRLALFSIVPDEDDMLLVYAVPGSLREAPREAVRRQRVARESGLPPVDVALEARDVSRHAVQMTRAQEGWLGALGVRSVGELNRTCIEGEVGELIHVAEGFHEKTIGRIADALAARGDEVKLVCIAGPSSSGKTTFIRRLRVQLQVNGLNPKGLGLDDYYVDRDRTPRGPDGELDFEALEALRLDLLTDHLSRLAAGREVRTARFDFPSGTSHPAGGALLSLGPRDILMVEGIHGLNPRLLAALSEAQVFRIFVCPLVQLPFDRLSRVHASDVRLLRRIVRDRHGRALNAAETIQRWPSVRAGERTHIFPYQNHADEVFDTSLVYEISVLKVYAERYLLEVPSAHPAQATAERLLDLLDRWVTIYPDHVPPTSILREFIGGSGFSY
ncbi:MAG TPA: cyclic nucleotide-binding domain-containing protein [Sandaracinaceae bacterium LLY-WYZ-13_1]|nr:cyclic nucleotide-binding domain-containing protein [Sandaracinaceae bacterium LLY-WYZ-13_1]